MVRFDLSGSNEAPVRSAGILLWRAEPLEVLIAHPGGPFWAKKDEGAWSIPKGLVDDGEDHYEAALREFREELGSEAPDGEAFSVGETQLKSGKVIVAWALRGDLDVSSIASNEFEMEWPPRSGVMATFPEVDRAGWFTPEIAKLKLNQAQGVFVDRLLGKLLDH